MENLPVVNPVIGAAIAQNMSKESDIKYLKDSLRLLERTNPCIAWWIKNYSKSTKDKIGSAYCGLMVYKLLENQCEADNLAEEMKDVVL
jgi:hypothetical protein